MLNSSLLRVSYGGSENSFHLLHDQKIWVGFLSGKFNLLPSSQASGTLTLEASNISAGNT